MNSLGTSYPGIILDDDGSFDMGSLKLDAPYALLTTNGYFIMRYMVIYLTVQSLCRQSLI